MIFEEIAKFVKINETDQTKVDAIKNAIKADTFEAPKLLVWEDMNQAVTGSHRIEAIRQLLAENENKWWDTEMDVLDVSEYISDTIEYDHLRSTFIDSDIADEVKLNSEW